jgi:hypothetical protein
MPLATSGGVIDAAPRLPELLVVASPPPNTSSRNLAGGDRLVVLDGAISTLSLASVDPLVSCDPELHYSLPVQYPVVAIMPPPRGEMLSWHYQT